MRPLVARRVEMRDMLTLDALRLEARLGLEVPVGAKFTPAGLTRWNDAQKVAASSGWEKT